MKRIPLWILLPTSEKRFWSNTFAVQLFRQYIYTHIILYEYDDSKAAGACVSEDSGSVALRCNLVAVPLHVNLSDEVVLNVCFITDDEAEHTSVVLEYPEEEKVCRHGSSELQVKVAWTATFTKPTSNEIFERRYAAPSNPFKIY